MMAQILAQTGNASSAHASADARAPRWTTPPSTRRAQSGGFAMVDSVFYNVGVPRTGRLRLSVCVSALRLRPNATSYGRPPGRP